MSMLVIFFILIQYLILDNWNELNKQKMDNFYQLGYEDGLFNSLNSIFQESENCQEVLITIGLEVRELVDINCIKINSIDAFP